MRCLRSAACAAIIAASLAACDSESPIERTAAGPEAAAPAGAALPAKEFRGAVAPAPAPAGTPTVDAALGDVVKRKLTTAPGINIGAIEVAAAGGVVTLYGIVEMPAEKDRAAMLALGVDGVRSVVNNLVVIRGS